MEKRHRIFVAINLPQEIKNDLARFYTKWPEIEARWTSKDNLHITLEFLGNLTDQELGEVCSLVKQVAERHKAFSLSLNQVIYGPPNKMPPKMVWAVGEKSKELSALRTDLQEILLDVIRFSPEVRSLAPHVTLARISTFAFRQMEQEEVPEINESLDLLFSVESIEVMESELRKGGPVYTILESHQLKN